MAVCGPCTRVDDRVDGSIRAMYTAACTSCIHTQPCTRPCTYMAVLMGRGLCTQWCTHVYGPYTTIYVARVHGRVDMYSAHIRNL